jgi:phenylpropionate dioxygenase-like ring-hydroxylating dioxygenase large terminal subunit
MKHIFEGNWIYLAHESQIPNNNDYYTTQIGRQPVFIARNKQGELNAFINACSHRGAQLCRHKRGNKATYTCPFHGWTFNNSGKLLKVKDPEDAGYPDCFNKEGSHDLKKAGALRQLQGLPVRQPESGRAPLEEFLGEAGKIIDMIVNQSPDGLEVLRGASTYTFEGNWKLQAENGADGYHVSAVHWNYAATTNRRKQEAAGREDKIRAMDAGNWGRQGGGFYAFDHGHMLLWTQVGESGRPAELPAPRRVCGTVRQGDGRLDGRALAQPVPVPERVPDGPVRLPDPRAAPDRGRQDRGDDLLHRAERRVRRGACPPHPPVRGLLQRQRHGHAGRPGRIPRLPDRLRRRAMQWNDMCRGATHWIQGAGRRGEGNRPGTGAERRAHRGRRPVHGAAPLLAGRDAAAFDAKGEAAMSEVAIHDIAAFLYREARLLDDEQWDEWLDCYDPDAQFWMPSWDDDGTLVQDPQREISLIYYPTRQGLEDRVFRIKTERSSATMPDTRTSHNIANIEDRTGRRARSRCASTGTR